MKTQVARKVLYVIAVLLMVGCTSPYRWEPTREELEPLDCVEGILPQEGTLLKLRLDYSFFTKFQAIEYTQQYRYRVLIDGEIYSYGVNTERIKSLSIPLMANDGYTRKTIVVEGSEALDYISSKEDKVNPSITWGEWHELYRGEQECLPAEQPQQYSSIKDSRLKFVIAGKKDDYWFNHMFLFSFPVAFLLIAFSGKVLHQEHVHRLFFAVNGNGVF